jgi:hypothetical protein
MTPHLVIQHWNFVVAGYWLNNEHCWNTCLLQSMRSTSFLRLSLLMRMKEMSMGAQSAVSAFSSGRLG